MEWAIITRRRLGDPIRGSASLFQPRNTAADPAFANFNNPLPSQDEPGTLGITIAPCSSMEAIDIPGTPSNERLMELAEQSPPPDKWFLGEEEDLF